MLPGSPRRVPIAALVAVCSGRGSERRGLARRAPLTALVAAALACAPSPSPDAAPFAEVVDDAGRRVVVAERPARVVSLIPAVTRVILALGAGDRLIARTDYDTHPTLDTLPSVGQGLSPNLEWLAARQPDLVIGWADGTSRDVLARLTMLGVPVYSARVETLEDADTAMLRLGTLLGVREQADSLVRRTRARLDSVRAAVADEPRPRLFYALGLNPPTTVGPGTFLNEVVDAAGADNIFGDAGAQWPRVSLEEVVARAPEVVIVPRGEGFVEPLERLPGWRDLPAVRAGRVHDVDADLFHRWGPDVALAAARLAAVLHPGSGAAALERAWTRDSGAYREEPR